MKIQANITFKEVEDVTVPVNGDPIDMIQYYADNQGYLFVEIDIDIMKKIVLGRDYARLKLYVNGDTYTGFEDLKVIN